MLDGQQADVDQDPSASPGKDSKSAPKNQMKDHMSPSAERKKQKSKAPGTSVNNFGKDPQMSKLTPKVAEANGYNVEQEELVIDLKTPLTTNNHISKIEPADEGSVIIGGDALMTEQNQTSIDDRNAESVRGGAQQ